MDDTEELPLYEETRQRKARITDEAWAQLIRVSVESRQAISTIVQVLLRNYFTTEVKPPIYRVSPSIKRSSRTIYIGDHLWKKVRMEGVLAGYKSASAVIEYVIRDYLDMDLGEPQE